MEQGDGPQQLYQQRGMPEMVKKALEKSSVYRKQESEENRQALENIGLRVGVWIMENFPEERLQNVSYQFALGEFKTKPIRAGQTEKEETPSTRDYFVEELSNLPFGLSNPRQFLNGLFKRVYFQLGGREFAP